MKIIWYMVLKYKVWQTETFVILSNFLPFQPPDKPEIQNFKIEKKHGVRQTEFFVILEHFLSFYPPMDPENQNFEKLKQPPGDIIILHKCIKSNDHILYCFLDRARNGFNCYFPSWGIFYPFTPPNSSKNQN